MNVRKDLGAYLRTHRAGTERSFLTPTLREPTWTAPYMHDGAFATPAEVVDFYDAGGGDDPLKGPRLRPLGLGPSEAGDLIAFLEALSGESFDVDRYVWREDDYDYAPIDNWRDASN